MVPNKLQSLGFPHDICLPYNSQAGIPATLLKDGRGRHHRISIFRRLIAKFSTDVGGKLHANIKEGVGLEFLREHADVLEVYDPKFLVRVEEKVLLLDVGVVDTTSLLERGRELLLNRGGQPRGRPAALRRLWERIVEKKFFDNERENG